MTPRRLTALVLAIALTLFAPAMAIAQETAPDPRAATGGAQTLSDIMARQQGLKVDEEYRRDATGNPDAAAPTTAPLGTLGGVSDPEMWRALRFGTADISTSARTPGAGLLVQDGGMRWLRWRDGPLRIYGGYLLLGMLGLLALFYLLRGKIRIEGETTGRTLIRFVPLERFAHWLMAGSFILLALTGLLLVFGRVALIPLFGREFFSPAAIAGKWVHNNVSWAFMLGLVMVTVLWVAQNIPNRHDLKWLALGGGLFSKGTHPPAKKFNAGQKIIFWAVVILGASISVSGLSLLFPYDMPLFAATFEKMNAMGIPGLLGMADFPTALAPQEEMQFAQLWHAIVGFVFMAIILAHIYLGTVGMEGAFDAMGKGEVDEQWAKEHHNLWYEEVTERPADTPAPAE